MNTSFHLSPIPSSRRACFAAALIAFAGLFFPTVAAEAKTHLKISATNTAIDAFQNWTSGVPWDQITNFKNANASRMVVDLVLELQALKAGGLDFDFEFVRSVSYELAKKEVIEGRVVLTAETIWEDEIDPNIMIKSDTILRRGEFVKGVYVLPTNQKLLGISSLDELRAFSGAVVSTWALDAKTMDDMKPKEVVKCPTPEIVYAKIKMQQAEFALWEFSANADMGVVVSGVKLVPVPNCKVAIMGSRSWIVSKAHPEATAIHAALQAGAKILRDNGTIERAYRESGFFNPRVADWKRLF